MEVEGCLRCLGFGWCCITEIKSIDCLGLLYILRKLVLWSLCFTSTHGIRDGQT